MSYVYLSVQPFQVAREGPIKPANTIHKDNVPFSADSMYKTVSADSACELIDSMNKALILDRAWEPIDEQVNCCLRFLGMKKL